MDNIAFGNRIFPPLLEELQDLSGSSMVLSGRVLLHACCAPCSGAILEAMTGLGICPTVFFSNSNIFPEEEYVHRREECRRYCASLAVRFVEDEYDHDAWERSVAIGFEDAPERGPRCERCFSYRLNKAARYAADNGFVVLTSTLASSRWKDLGMLSRAGEQACSLYSGTLSWWGRNWRKNGLQVRRSEIIREQNFYNQRYCGCPYSMQHLQNNPGANSCDIH